jgi:hypothetical protein
MPNKVFGSGRSINMAGGGNIIHDLVHKQDLKSLTELVHLSDPNKLHELTLQMNNNGLTPLELSLQTNSSVGQKIYHLLGGESLSGGDFSNVSGLYDSLTSISQLGGSNIPYVGEYQSRASKESGHKLASEMRREKEFNNKIAYHNNDKSWNTDEWSNAINYKVQGGWTEAVMGQHGGADSSEESDEESSEFEDSEEISNEYDARSDPDENDDSYDNDSGSESELSRHLTIGASSSDAYIYNYGKSDNDYRTSRVNSYRNTNVSKESSSESISSDDDMSDSSSDNSEMGNRQLISRVREYSEEHKKSSDIYNQAVKQIMEKLGVDEDTAKTYRAVIKVHLEDKQGLKGKENDTKKMTEMKKIIDGDLKKFMKQYDGKKMDALFENRKKAAPSTKSTKPSSKKTTKQNRYIESENIPFSTSDVYSGWE